MRSWRILEQWQGFVSGSRSRLYLYDLGTNSWNLTGELMQVTDLELNLKKDKAVFAASSIRGWPNSPTAST